MQYRISRYKNWEDAQRSLLGKALLINGLKDMGEHSYSLNNLKVTEFEKPYFDDSIDFNISHSGEYVVCALSLTGKVGVDVERLQEVPLNDFKDNFSHYEWQTILKADNQMYSFFKQWTKKEAFLKAIGVGLNLSLKNIEIKDNKIAWEDKEWFLYEIKLNEKHISHVASNLRLPKIEIEEVNFNN